MFRVSNKLKTFFVNSSLVTIQGKLDIVTASFWSNLRHIYSQISQLWVSTKGLGGWPTSDFVSLQFINTLLFMGPEPELVLSGGQWTDVNCSIVSYCQAQSGSISNLNSEIEPDIKVCNRLARPPTSYHPPTKQLF